MGRNSAVSERSMWALGDDINRPCGTRLELIALSTNCSNRNTVSYLESPFHCSEFWYGLSREQALSLFCLENVYTWYGVERRTANTSGCLSVCISYPLHAENDSRNLWPYRTPEHQLNGLKWPTSLYYACVCVCWAYRAFLPTTMSPIQNCYQFKCVQGDDWRICKSFNMCGNGCYSLSHLPCVFSIRTRARFNFRTQCATNVRWHVKCQTKWKCH